MEKMSNVAEKLWVVVLIVLRLALGEGTTLKSSNLFKSENANEYCSGYTDKHGQWNNGFFCPKWDRPDQTYCCGPENHRYCCPRQRDTQSDAAKEYQSQIPLLAGLTVAILLTLTLLNVASCYCCPCCFVYKRRKLRLQDRSMDSLNWHMTVPTPIRYEMSAAACVSTPRDSGPGVLNPPPYDEKDAPPKYSSVCGMRALHLVTNPSFPETNFQLTNGTSVTRQAIGPKKHAIGQMGHVLVQSHQGFVNTQHCHVTDQRASFLSSPGREVAVVQSRRPEVQREESVAPSTETTVDEPTSTELCHPRPNWEEANIHTSNCELLPLTPEASRD